jgi:hypothetical protein
MTWEVWAIPTSNLIAAEATEAEALAVVRQLLASDWAPDELTLIFDDPSLADEELPPAVTGDDLARRAGVTSGGSVRRTA